MSTELDLSHCRIKPYDHQIVGIKKLVLEPVVGLFDEMGSGKSKQTIDAAQILFTQGKINRVLIVAPASVRHVWYDPELGELVKHLWEELPARIMLFHGKIKLWDWFVKDRTAPRLDFIVVNYEFIREESRLIEAMTYTGPKTLLVLDESSAIKSYKAQQTKACFKLRKRCGRIVLLNGTPIANSPRDMFSQGNIMDKSILECKTIYNFRARYGVIGGYQNRQIIKWINIDDLQRRFAPYVLRRLKSDCLDLPPKMPPVILPVELTDITWRKYKEMRRDLIVWLSNNLISTAQQAAVRGMRLAQITSGFLGGVHDAGVEREVPLPLEDDRPDFIPFLKPDIIQQEPTLHNLMEEQRLLVPPVQTISCEKLDAFIEWLEEQLVADPQLKLLVWCRFRPELARLIERLESKPYSIALGQIHGGQKKDSREMALRLLDPRTMPPGPVVVAGTPASGSMGLNLAGAHTVVYMSNDYSLKTRLQSEDRVHRPGQTYPVSYFDMVATGPKGQKTIDHTIIKSLRNKNDLATFTTSAWLQALTEEAKDE